MESSNALSDDEAAAYADDPVADEEWTARYEEEMRLNEELEQRLLLLTNGKIPTTTCVCLHCIFLEFLLKCHVSL